MKHNPSLLGAELPFQVNRITAKQIWAGHPGKKTPGKIGKLKQQANETGTSTHETNKRAKKQRRIKREMEDPLDKLAIQKFSDRFKETRERHVHPASQQNAFIKFNDIGQVVQQKGVNTY